MILLQRKAQNWRKLNSHGPLDLLPSCNCVWGEVRKGSYVLEVAT